LNVLDYDYYFKVVDAALNSDIPANLLTYHEILSKGFDGGQFLIGLAEHLRNLLVCKDDKTISLLEVPNDIKSKYQEQAEKAIAEFLLVGKRFRQWAMLLLHQLICNQRIPEHR